MTKAAIPPCFAPGTTSARLSTIRQHTVDLGGSDLDDTIIRKYHALYISEAGSVRASQWLRREHAADMVTHLTGPECLME